MSGTTPLATLRELFDYNYWARDRQLQTCAGLAEEQFLRPLGNSFPSVRDTLTHLLAVEWLWLERWRGRSPRTLIQPAEFPTLTSLSERWKIVVVVATFAVAHHPVETIPFGSDGAADVHPLPHRKAPLARQHRRRASQTRSGAP